VGRRVSRGLGAHAPNCEHIVPQRNEALASYLSFIEYASLNDSLRCLGQRWHRGRRRTSRVSRFNEDSFSLENFKSNGLQ